MFSKRLRLNLRIWASVGDPRCSGLVRVLGLTDALSLARYGRTSSSTSVDLRLSSTSLLRTLRLPWRWKTEERNLDQTWSSTYTVTLAMTVYWQAGMIGNISIYVAKAARHGLRSKVALPVTKRTEQALYF